MNAPKKFVGLHAHTTYSVSDGFGQPEEHIDYAIENGMDALAITEHGNMNSFPSAYFKSQDLKKKGVNFKFIGGVEAYYHPDLNEWAKHKQEYDEQKKLSKFVKEVDTEDGVVLENEEESKNISKYSNPINRRHHLILLAKSNKGLENLFRMISHSYKDGFYRFPRIDQKLLKKYGEDIIVNTACIGGPLAYDAMIQHGNLTFEQLEHNLSTTNPTAYKNGITQMLNTLDKLYDAVGEENVFAELQFNKLSAQHLVNKSLIELHTNHNVKLVSAADSHYPNPNLWQAREIYKLLGRMKLANFSPDLLPSSVEELKCLLYPKNAEQMWNSYNEYRTDDMDFYQNDIVAKSIENTWHIAHDMIGELKTNNTLCLPNFVVPNGMTDMQALVVACKDGLIQRGLAHKQEYIERLKTELLVVKEKNFAKYFLLVKKIIDIAQTSVMVGAGRGSGPGSLINYVLNITDLDPIKYGLYFERFLNKSRSDPPDIDSDFSDRDKLINLIKDNFGKENVIPITNWNVLKFKSLLKDISKFYGIDFIEVNAITSKLDEEVSANASDDNKSFYQLNYDDCIKWSQNFRDFIEKYPQVGEHIKEIYKNIRSAGRHAGGVIIAEDLDGKMPLIAVRGEIQTPWTEGLTSRQIEPIIGIPKVDILGLDTLRMINRCIEIIIKKHENNQNPSLLDIKKWYDTHLKPGVIDECDSKVFENVFDNKKFAGIFQFTAPNTQKFITNFKPRSVDDLSQATAIYRPGPLGANVDKLIIESRNNNTKKLYGHEAIDRVLAPTMGYCIFQENVMQLAHELAGMSLVDCDRLRKAILKRSTSTLGQEKNKSESEILEEQFITGAVNNGYPLEKSKLLYEEIAQFSKYAFNKSHSLAYAFCSYQTAWLMTYYEPEWLCAYVESMIDKPDSRSQAINEIKSFGYKIGKVDINVSSFNWEIDYENKTFFPSFKTIKGIGDVAIEEIVRNRPYTNIENLLWDEDGKWKHSKFNKRVMQNLISLEAFDSMKMVLKDDPSPFGNYKQMYNCIVANIDKLKKKNGKEFLYNFAKENLFEEDWSATEKIKNSKDLIGIFDIEMIVDDKMQNYLKSKGALSIDNLSEETQIVWFVLSNIEKKKTKNDKSYAVLTVIGTEGKEQRVFCWGMPENINIDVDCAYLAPIEKNNFGMSTKFHNLKRIKI